ncbi:MAG: twin-arginine translocase subunit TatC [Nitrososphaerales archaeon]
MSRDMTILEHIDELRKRLVRILITVGAIALFSFTFGFKEFTIQGTRVPLPFPDPFDNLASQAIRRIEEDLLPDYVRVIVTAPSQAIIAELFFSIFLGILLGMPVIIRETAAFLGPALYPEERKRILRLALPGTFLFMLGAVFSYVFITPFTIDFLYRYGFGIVEEIFITIDDFISFVLLFTIAFGLSFELPILMWLLTAAGIVDPDFWRKNVSYVVVVLAVYGAVITPDGSGITMWFVAGPMLVLYVLGYFIIKRRIGAGKAAGKV